VGYFRGFVLRLFSVGPIRLHPSNETVSMGTLAAWLALICFTGLIKFQGCGLQCCQIQICNWRLSFLVLGVECQSEAAAVTGHLELKFQGLTGA